jgi:hypothetical protein
MTYCPFCGRDPFHRTDSGEAVAVTCCDLGDLLFRGARSTPEEVTISWNDFATAGEKLAALNDVARLATRLVEYIRDEGPPAQEWQAISAVTTELGTILGIPMPDDLGPSRLERCDCCEGGFWEVECCNGSGGCSCKGQRVAMGPCNVCRGTGWISPDADRRANLRTIEGLCYIGSGPRF